MLRSLTACITRSYIADGMLWQLRSSLTKVLKTFHKTVLPRTVTTCFGYVDLRGIWHDMRTDPVAHHTITLLHKIRDRPAFAEGGCHLPVGVGMVVSAYVSWMRVLDFQRLWMSTSSFETPHMCTVVTETCGDCGSRCCQRRPQLGHRPP